MTGLPDENSTNEGRFIRNDETEFESMPGRDHHWYVKPERIDETNLLIVRVQIPPGGGHPFHHHPNMEEFLYVLSGTNEQWVDDEQQFLESGDSVHLPAGCVHGTYNPADTDLTVLAVLSPADADPPEIVDVSEEEPWINLRELPDGT